MNSIFSFQTFNFFNIISFAVIIGIFFTGCMSNTISKKKFKQEVFAKKNTPNKIQQISPKPNVILILTDDLGWKDLSCYGSKLNITPNIDNLARNGILFTDAYASSPVCSPSRASLLTGKSPARLHLTHIIQSGISNNLYWESPKITPYLPLGERTIASELKKNGYTTAIIGKWHIGGYGNVPEKTGNPEKYGFDFNIAGSYQGQTPDYFYPYKLKWNDGRIFTLPNAPPGKPGDYLDDRLTDEAVKFIEKHKNEPFFLYLSYFLPHTSTGDRLQAKKELIEKNRKRLGKNTVDKIVVYAAMVEQIDINIGRILHSLKKSGIEENTIIIFTSDNGGNGHKTTNLPLRGAKGNLYEGGVRVPLIVYWKEKFQKGRIESTPVIGYDLFPTILEIAGLPPVSDDIDGVSLLPLLPGTGKINRNAIYWHFPHFKPGPAASAIRKGKYKLLEIYDRKNPRLELYNLESDIGEKNNLVEKNKEIAESLYKQLKQWKKDVGAQNPIPLRQKGKSVELIKHGNKSVWYLTNKKMEDKK